MLNALKNLEGYSEKVAVIIPGTADVNKEVDNSAQVREAFEVFAGLFGGATAEKIQGAWMSEEFGLVIENNVRIYSFSDELTDEKMDIVIAFAKKLKKEMNQEAIALEVNGKLYFI